MGLGGSHCLATLYCQSTADFIGRIRGAGEEGVRYCQGLMEAVESQGAS